MRIFKMKTVYKKKGFLKLIPKLIPINSGYPPFNLKMKGIFLPI